MSRKIARITQEKKLLLANKVVEDNTKIRLNSDGRLDTDEIIEYPAELEGGRNLLRNSSFENGFSQWLDGFQNGLRYWTVSDNFSYHGNSSACLMGRDAHYWRGVCQVIYDVSVGETYTASAFVKCDPDVRYGASIKIRISKDGGATWLAGPYITSSSENWTRISCSYTVENGVNALNFEFYGSTGNPVGKGVYVDAVKLEKGSQATPWTPAPEDLGLNYPDSIQNFNSSISGNNIITPEFIEGYPFVKPVIDDSLVLWLDGSTGNNYEQTGTWKDLSGNGNDGQLVNFGYIEDSGWGDGGLKFDGVDDYVRIPANIIDVDEDFTIEIVAIGDTGEMGTAPFSLLRSTNRRNSIWNEKGFGISSIYNPRTLAFIVRDDVNYKRIEIVPGPSGQTIYFNGHICVKKEGNIIYTYYNYSVKNYGDISELSSFKTDNNIIISDGYDSHVKLLRIYNRALTDEEILQNYQAGQCSPLLAMRGDV